MTQLDGNAIFGKIVEIITPYAKKKEALGKVTQSTHILEDLGINSARLVDIILDMEDAFSIAIDDQSADKVRTLGDATALVSRLSTS